MKIVHQCCGSHGKRHLKTCERARIPFRPNRASCREKPQSPRLPNGELVTVETCREYFDLIGNQIMTPMQTTLFKFLLELAEEA